MDSARTPPEQEMTAPKNRRCCRQQIPLEIVEQILLNLPVQSLVRFSFVSKSWKSIISDPRFIRNHRGRAALHGGETMVIKPTRRDYVDSASFCPLSSISSDNPIIEDATAISCPIYPPFLIAACDELWCVSVSDSLFLWNPSIRTYKKLPDPSLPPEMRILNFIYGLGYDSVGDDYKILKIHLKYFRDKPFLESELYSLRSDSWKKIEPFPGNHDTRRKGVFVSGALHWMVRRGDYSETSSVIVSFDLSIEKYGEVALPRYDRHLSPRVEITVLRGMLCVCLNYERSYQTSKTFDLWAMKDYGVHESWTKMFGIDYSNSIPYFPPTTGRQEVFTLRPLYFYDSGDILVKVSTDTCSGIYVYENEDAVPKKIVCRNKLFLDGFLFVESLISPATWPRAAPTVGNNE